MNVLSDDEIDDLIQLMESPEELAAIVDEVDLTVIADEAVAGDGFDTLLKDLSPEL